MLVIAMTEESQKQMFAAFEAEWAKVVDKLLVCMAEKDSSITRSFEVVQGTLVASLEKCDYMTTKERMDLSNKLDWALRWGILLGSDPDSIHRIISTVPREDLVVRKVPNDVIPSSWRFDSGGSK